MTAPQIEIQIIAAVTAAACALLGVFLVLRRSAMMSDAISHTVLLGIVLAFFIVEDFSNPLLIIGAAAIGVLTVTLTELLRRTRLVKEDAAIGLVFPALFSIAVILISVFARNVHLDTHIVFQGDLAFAPFERLALFGVDLGPRTLDVMLGILLLNVLFVVLFYKELKLSTFDAGLAAALGFSPVLLHYALMTLVSVTVVGAFDAVGSILVIALMVAPPATAYLLTDRLSRMLGLSVLLGVVGAISGYWLAHALNTNIGAAMVTMLGVLFALAFLVCAPARHDRPGSEATAPEVGLRPDGARHPPSASREHTRGQRGMQHGAFARPSALEAGFAAHIVQRAEHRGYLTHQNGRLSLSPLGRQAASEAAATA